MPWIALNPAEAEAPPATSLGLPRVSYGKTFASMKEELRLKLGGRGDATAQLGRWINDAYVDLCSSLQLDELKGSITLDIVAGQPFYLLPDVVETILSVAIVLEPTALRPGYPLTKIEAQSYRGLADSSGEPSAYFRHGQMLVLWPEPLNERSLAVEFRLQPVELSADTDSPLLDRMWHEGIMLLARQKAFSDLLEFDKAALAGNEFTDFVRRKRDREANEDENRIIMSSVPRRLRDLRNTVYSRDWEDV